MTGSEVGSCVLRAHATQAVALVAPLRGWTVPAGHRSQWPSPATPSAAPALPGVQLRHVVASAAPRALDKEPSGQGRHAEAAAADATAVDQSSHADRLVAPSTTKRPAPHGARSATLAAPRTAPKVPTGWGGQLFSKLNGLDTARTNSLTIKLLGESLFVCVNTQYRGAMQAGMVPGGGSDLSGAGT